MSETSVPAGAQARLDLGAYRRPPHYDPGPLLRRVLWLAVSRVFFETRFPWPSAWKAAWLRVFGARVGEGLVIKPRVQVKFPWKLSLGGRCWIGEGVWIDNPAPVALGSQVVLSQGVRLTTGNHDYRSSAFDLRLEPIEIGDGAWIAAHALVAPGAKVERLAVLAFGSVGIGTLRAGWVHAGHPAAPVRRRGELEC